MGVEQVLEIDEIKILIIAIKSNRILISQTPILFPSNTFYKKDQLN
jgi:hypothetical protein